MEGGLRVEDDNVQYVCPTCMRRILWPELKTYPVSYVSLPPGCEWDIFQRVQLGMPLTAAGMLRHFSPSQPPLRIMCRETPGDLFTVGGLDFRARPKYDA